MTSGRMFALKSCPGLICRKLSGMLIKRSREAYMGESLSRFVRVVGSSKVRGNLSMRMGCNQGR